MIVRLGSAVIGRVSDGAGGAYATRFAFVMGIPIVPIGGVDGNGEPAPLSLRSIASVYLTPAALVASAAIFSEGVYGFIEARDGNIAVGAALLLLAFVLLAATACVCIYWQRGANMPWVEYSSLAGATVVGGVLLVAALNEREDRQKTYPPARLDAIATLFHRAARMANDPTDGTPVCELDALKGARVVFAEEAYVLMSLGKMGSFNRPSTEWTKGALGSVTTVTSKSLQTFIDHDGPAPDYTHVALIKRDGTHLYLAAKNAHDCRVTLDRDDSSTGKPAVRSLDYVLGQLGGPARL